MPEADPSFWTVQLFKDELVALLEHLGISDNYILLGQSWGGMLAMEHALDNPTGLRALIVCDSPASMPLWVKECDRLRGLLPQAIRPTALRNVLSTISICAGFRGPTV
jgi:L-proline amide hydrolase